MICEVTRLLHDDGVLVMLVTLALLSKPVDDLMLTFLKLDAAGKILADVTAARARVNPIRIAQRAFVQDLCSGIIVDALARYFPLPEGRQEQHMGKVRAIIMQLAGAVHYRVDRYFKRYPFVLLGMVHPDKSCDEQQDVVNVFMGEKECCLDPFCSRRLRSRFPTAASLWSSQSVRKAFLAWLTRGKVAVGHMERGHTENNASFLPTRKVRRQVEGAIYHSFLRRLMSSHTGRGRLNYSLQQNDSKYSSRLGLKLDKFNKRRRVRRAGTRTRSRLVAPRQTQLAARPRGKVGGNARWRYVSYQSQTAKRIRANGRWTREQEMQARQQWAHEWDTMPLEARESWERMYVQPAINDLEPPVALAVPRAPDLLDMLREDLMAEDMVGKSGSSRVSIPLDIGDEIWPVASKMFEDQLAAKAQRLGLTEWRGGVQRVGSAWREELRQEMVVDCDPCLQPVLRVPVQCSVRHPGICCTRDAAYYDDCLALATRIGHELRSGCSFGSFVGFHTYRFSQLFCLAVNRLRDPDLSVLAACSFCADDDTITICTDDNEEFVFTTHYTIARELVVACLDVPHEVTFTRFSVRDDSATPLTVHVTGREHILLRDPDPGRDGDGHDHDGGGGGLGGGRGDHGDHPRGVDRALEPDLLEVIAQADEHPGAPRAPRHHGVRAEAPVVIAAEPLEHAIDEASDMPDDESAYLSDDDDNQPHEGGVVAKGSISRN